MSDKLNMTEATMKMRMDAPEIIGQLETDKKFKGLTLTFEQDGKMYDLTLSRSRDKS